MFYHSIRLANGIIIYLPSSVRPELYKFIDTSNMIKDPEMDAFKRKVSVK